MPRISIKTSPGTPVFCTKSPWHVEIWKTSTGVYHREDGPAEIFKDGDIYWHLDDELMDFDDYCEVLKSYYGKTDEDIMMLRMQYDID